MQLTHLLIFSCLLFVSVCSDKDTINKIEEFKKYFSDYAKQASSSSDKTLFPILLKQTNVCPCAHDFLKKLQESFGKQNTTEVLIMKTILTSLMGQIQKPSKTCPIRRVTASETLNFKVFFERFLSQNCISQSKPKIG
ncbi:uncharacterized protein LOC143963581 [Lithobates pipiens]